MHPIILYVRGAAGLYTFYLKRAREGFDEAGAFKMEYRKQWELAAAMYRVERRREKANESR